VDEGIRLGVIVTPAFFIHGRLIVGSASNHSLSLRSNLLKPRIKSSSLSRISYAENAPLSRSLSMREPCVVLVWCSH
jgi:hypothetical protein